MTAIVAIAEGGDVVLGIDSCSTAAGKMAIDNPGKGPVAFHFDGHPDLLLACAGSHLLQNEIVWDWTPPTPATTDPLTFLRACAVSLRAHFTAEPTWTMAKDDSGRGVDGHFVAAWRGVAVEISGDFAVTQYRSGEVAIGSGRDFLFGALWATKGRPAEERVWIALEAAAHYQEDVAPPFSIRWAGK